MNQIDEKIVQCKKDLAAIQVNLTKLEAEKKLQESPKWLAAKTVAGSRLILNLSSLSSDVKHSMKRAIDENKTWISLTNYYNVGAVSSIDDGLTQYSNTEIIFGDK